MNLTSRRNARPMRWTLSEFLNLIELRSQCWCLVDLGPEGGFNVPHTDNLLFYACLDGKARLDGLPGGAITIEAGDVLMLLNGDAHAIRSQKANNAEILDFLYRREYVDIPPRFSIGSGKSAELLCGCLMVRWPGGERPRALPSLLRTRSRSSLGSLQALVASADQEGAAAVLTQAASLAFTATFRHQPECRNIFNESTRQDPIVRAKQFMETHPFHDWTVEILATKVGMSRSNFAAHFVEETGSTPMGYLAALRMDHAVGLLEKTDMKIAAVGEYVGYRSEAAFSRRFTRHFGQPPGKMRQSLQNANQQASIRSHQDSRCHGNTAKGSERISAAGDPGGVRLAS